MNPAKKKPEEVILQVYHSGELTVVGFAGQLVETRIDFSKYRVVLMELIRKSGCRVLALDLAGVKFAPAGILGVLIPIRQLVDRIEIHNPTETAKETLSMIQKDSLFEICETVAL